MGMVFDVPIGECRAQRRSTEVLLSLRLALVSSLLEYRAQFWLHNSRRSLIHWRGATRILKGLENLPYTRDIQST